MMNNYYDQQGRLHDKPVTPTDPFPCNNTFTYSAYAVKVGLKLNMNPEVLTICAVDYVRHRKQDKLTGPTSREEALGLSYLGYTPDLLTRTWRFNSADYPIPKLSISQLITQALALLIIQPYYKRILGVDIKMWHFEMAHRNFFWANKLDQIYRFAFSVPLQDRYSILKWSGRFKWYLPSHLAYGMISLIDRLGKPSGIRWLKYGEYVWHTKRDENLAKAMVSEFPQDHPIRQRVGL